MRLINKICRFPFAVIISILFAVLVYVVTIFTMLLFNWDKELASLKKIHKDIWNGCFLVIMGIKEETNANI